MATVDTSFLNAFYPEESLNANSGSSDHAFRYELIRFSGCN